MSSVCLGGVVVTMGHRPLVTPTHFCGNRPTPVSCQLFEYVIRVAIKAYLKIRSTPCLPLQTSFIRLSGLIQGVRGRRIQGHCLREGRQYLSVSEGGQEVARVKVPLPRTERKGGSRCARRSAWNRRNLPELTQISASTLHNITSNCDFACEISFPSAQLLY